MKILKILSIIVFLLVSSAQADYVETRDLRLPSEDIDELEINCGAGYLEIRGDDNLDEIEVTAEIIIEGMSKSRAEEFMEDCMTLSLEKKWGGARLESIFEQHGFSFSSIFDDGSARIDLLIKIPRNLKLDVDDGSGDIAIEGMENDITIKDGSGEIEIKKLKGGLRISDGSGDIRITDLEGEIRLEDGSGELLFANIMGDIRLDDGSGDIDLEQITGSVDIDDGSGEIDAIVLDGDIFIEDGSGNINIREITGNVEINDGSGDMDVEKIGGSVIIDDDSGDIRIDDVEGDVEIIDDGSGRCKITGVNGRVRR